MKKGQFSFQTRMGMQVGTAVAEEIQNNPEYAGSPTATNVVRPVLLSFSGTTFRFEGGIVVKVNMIDLDQFTESWRTPHCEDWVVTHVDVRYRPFKSYADNPTDEKTSEVWGAEKLLALKEVRPWYHPHVVPAETITGRIGIFWNNGMLDGHVEVDPEYNNSGHYTLVHAVVYYRFVKGDLDRAKKEAREILSSYGK